MRKVLAVLFCVGVMGCATAEFARYRGGAYESAIPIYQGDPLQQFPYGSVGFINGEYKAGVFELPDDKISKALAQMANHARSMGANAIIKVKLRSGISTVYYQGEAVYFNKMPNR